MPLTSNILKEKVAKLKFNVLDWPPKNSPDVNPVERMWSTLDKKSASKPIQLILAFNDRPHKEWNNIERNLCIKLVESMPKWIRKCCRLKVIIFFKGHCIFTLRRYYCFHTSWNKCQMLKSASICFHWTKSIFLKKPINSSLICLIQWICRCFW